MATVMLSQDFYNELRQFFRENEDVPVASHLLGFLDRNPDGIAFVSKVGFNRMRDAELMLDCLKGAGVDNWGGYDDAMEDYWVVKGGEDE